MNPSLGFPDEKPKETTSIKFPIIRLPKLTSKVEEALISQNGGRFAKIWSALLTMQGTMPIDHGKLKQQTRREMLQKAQEQQIRL